MSPRDAVTAALFGVVAAAVLSACTSATNGDDNGGDVVVIPTVTQPASAPASAPATPASPSASASHAGPARPVASPCTSNARGRLVFVSLRRQHLWMCAAHRIVRDTAITSGRLGRHTGTPTGSYRIQGLNRNSVLTLNTGATYPVKYWIPFDAPLYGFHDSRWQRFPYGSDLYRTRGSHGCVRMPIAAIRFLYHWADIGTRVRIRA